MRRVLVKSRLLNGVNLANQKLSQNLEFEFVNFGIFALSKVTYLVPLFYRKLQVFQKLGQMDHF